VCYLFRRVQPDWTTATATNHDDVSGPRAAAAVMLPPPQLDREKTGPRAKTSPSCNHAADVVAFVAAVGDRRRRRTVQERPSGTAQRAGRRSSARAIGRSVYV